MAWPKLTHLDLSWPNSLQVCMAQPKRTLTLAVAAHFSSTGSEASPSWYTGRDRRQRVRKTWGACRTGVTPSTKQRLPISIETNYPTHYELEQQQPWG